jgi:hypothetical protein
MAQILLSRMHWLKEDAKVLMVTFGNIKNNLYIYLREKEENTIIKKR